MQIDILKKNKIIDKLSQYWLVMFIAPIALTIVSVALFGINVPFNEQWEFSAPLAKMLANKNSILPELWKLHNEHRLVFPKFIMLLLASLTNWDIRAELIVNLFLAGSILYVLVYKARQTLTYVSVVNPKHLLKVAFIGLSLLTFSMAQSENWMWGWQLQIFLNVLMIIIGFDWLTRSDHLTFKEWLVAVLCGLIATFSFANGLLYWLVGLVGLIARSFSRPTNRWLVVGWLVLSIAIWIVYFINYHSVSQHPPISYISTHPGEAIQYLFGYLGNSISQFRQLIPVGVFIGLLGGILLVTLSFRLIKNKLLLHPTLLFWHLLLLYAIMSDCITALGRTGFGVEQAFSSRYATISNLFWLWILIIFCWQYQRKMVRFSGLSYGVCLLLFLLYSASTAKNTYKFKQRRDELRIVVSELQKKMPNKLLLIAAHPKPDSVIIYNMGLRQNNLSFYHTH